MIKIEFGHSNDINPNGSWEGIHISEDLPLTSADYYGSIQLGEKSYIVAKVVEDEYNRYPELLNNFIVREALVDLYKDGSGILFLDQEKTEASTQIERFLNSSRIKEKIKDKAALISECREIGAYRASNAFSMIEQEGKIAPIVSTSITHEAFNKKFESLKYCHGSFSDLQSQIEELQKQLQEKRKPNTR